MSVAAIKRNPTIYWDMLKQPVLELSGCKIVHTGIQSPWLNGVVDKVADDIDLVINYFKERNTPFCWWSDCECEPAGFRDALSAHEMISLGEFTGMSLDLNQITAPSQHELKVELVSSYESLKAFITVLMQVYEADPSIFENTTKLFWNAGVQPPTYHFLGKVDEIAVTVGSFYVDSDGVASVFNMGTLAAYRKRGFASHLLKTALQRVEQLATSSSLIATPEAVAMYRRMGYSSVNKFQLYMAL